MRFEGRDGRFATLEADEGVDVFHAVVAEEVGLVLLRDAIAHGDGTEGVADLVGVPRRAADPHARGLDDHLRPHLDGAVVDLSYEPFSLELIAGVHVRTKPFSLDDMSELIQRLLRESKAGPQRSRLRIDGEPEPASPTV